jgi:type IV pilus assembly protein PilE
MKARSLHCFIAARRRTAGFTLVELMIVVVIIAILAGIAVPSYRAYVVRGHRAAAKACMSEYTQYMERWYTTRMTYVGAAPTLGCATESGLDTRYTLSAAVVAPTQRTYTVTATPIGAQLASDTKCGTLTVDQTGARTKSGTGTLAECW